MSFARERGVSDQFSIDTPQGCGDDEIVLSPKEQVNLLIAEIGNITGNAQDREKLLRRILATTQDPDERRRFQDAINNLTDKASASISAMQKEMSEIAEAEKTRTDPQASQDPWDQLTENYFEGLKERDVETFQGCLARQSQLKTECRSAKALANRVTEHVQSARASK